MDCATYPWGGAPMRVKKRMASAAPQESHRRAMWCGRLRVRQLAASARDTAAATGPGLLLGITCSANPFMAGTAERVLASHLLSLRCDPELGRLPMKR